MLRRDRTVVAVDAVMHHLIDFMLAVDELIRWHADWRRDVVVQVAISQMAKGHHPYARELLGKQGVGFTYEITDTGNRHRYIVLDILAFIGLRQSNMFTQVP